LNDLGRNLRIANDLTGSQKALEESLEHVPGDPTALKELGYTFVASGQKQKALDAFQEFLKESPEDAEIQPQAAMLAFDLQEYPLAAGFYESMAKAGPMGAEEWFRLGQCYFEMKKLTDAERALLTAAEKDGRVKGLNLLLAKTYVLQNRYVEAAKFFRAELAASPQDIVLQQTFVEVSMKAAEEFVSQRQPNEAVSMLNQALSVPSSKQAEIHYRLAQILMGQKKTANALSHLSQAVKLDRGLKRTASRDRAFNAVRKQQRFLRIVR
jgi:tetratricopeptide (TPR) repeat protein